MRISHPPFPAPNTIFPYNKLQLQPFYSQDLISNSPYCLPYSPYYVGLENLVLAGSTNNPLIDIFFILITCLPGILLNL